MFSFDLITVKMMESSSLSPRRHGGGPGESDVDGEVGRGESVGGIAVARIQVLARPGFGKKAPEPEPIVGGRSSSFVIGRPRPGEIRREPSWSDPRRRMRGGREAVVSPPPDEE